MNTDTVPLVIFKTGEEAHAHGPGGCVWEEDESSLYVVLPGANDLDCIQCTRNPDEKAPRVWILTGDKEKPTLHPSLHMVGQWHGWLKDGVLVSC